MATGASQLGVALRRARWSARSHAAGYGVYLPLARLRHRHRVIGAETEVVIEGFTRSACVFAAVAFQQAQPRPVRLAHLVHAPAQLIAAAERGVPSLVTVREPEAAVVSCLRREPYLAPGQVLAAWTRFYARLMPWRDAMVVGEFSRVTTDLGGLIAEMNARFKTSFTPFQSTPENVRRVFGFIDERASRPPWEEHIGLFMSGLEDAGRLDEARRAGSDQPGRAHSVPFEHRVARPSPEREAAKSVLIERYRSPSLASARRRADELFAAFTASTASTAAR